jgi:hypothetical protein
MQRLIEGEFLAHYHFSLNIQPNQVEDYLAKIESHRNDDDSSATMETKGLFELRR